MALGSQAYPQSPQLLVPPFTQSPPQSLTNLSWQEEPVRACPLFGSFPLLCLTFSSTFLLIIPPPLAHTSREKPQVFRL
jgi:hypothetical protein